MKKLLKILSLCLITALLFSFTACTKPVKPENNDDVVLEEVEIEMPGIMLSSGEAIINEDGTISKTLTATVLPEDAPNKSVDWSVEWLENNEGEDAIVTDYLTVTPTEDGALTATVTAHKSFLGSSINVICITRVGNYRAVCTASCSGTPEYIYFEFEGTEYKHYTDTIMLNAGETYTFDLMLYNALGEVAEEYGTFEIIEVGGRGKFNASLYERANGSEPISVVVDLETKKIDSRIDLSFYSFFETDLTNDGKLTIVAKSNETSLSYSGSNFSCYYESEYQDPRATEPMDCYFIVQVKEINSGLTMTINFDIESTVTDVNLDSNSLVF